MKKLTVFTPAKINLTLDIKGRRDDGYHEIDSVMHNLTLRDRVEVSQTKNKQIILRCNLRYVPTDERNTAYKAAKVFFESAPVPFTGVFIHINKRIPVSAGLAGGSSNAAGVLAALNSLYDNALTRERLAELALSIGSDVPFCLFGRPARVTGLGEKLSAVPPLPDCFIVLAKPRFGISTKKAYDKFDEMPPQQKPDTQGMLEALEKKDLAAAGALLCNVMQAGSQKLNDEVAPLLETMKVYSPEGCLMSGSGPTVYGIFDSQKKAENAAAGLKRLAQDVFVTKPYHGGVSFRDIK